MLSALFVVSFHPDLWSPGQFSIWLGANILLLGGNNLLRSALPFCSFNVMFGAFVTWYSLS